ncbi:MAG: ribosomal protein S18-alanine N-acetyltransferase, partial [Alphaproteobacteria bacterium]|nr:ribosomal protein S18-alanine N-acetyltransferase [Alphaproteobacteria bacterium]
DDLVRIHGQCFTDPWSQDTFETLLSVYGTYGISVEDLNQVVGFVLYRQPFDDGEILTICIDPDFENKGFGTRLMEALLQHLTKPGKCFLEVSPKNTSAMKLYEKFQFQMIQVRKDYYAQGLDALVLMRPV